MRKTANVSGFCPYFDKNVTIRATFIDYSPLGANPGATPEQNLCEHFSECGRSADPDDCPVFNQEFPWNEL